jgi:hypothetical protein|tara:strand:+ start:2648 stop:3034 length:387 start_codon:yes stop_codon:yes gene_type:complete
MATTYNIDINQGSTLDLRFKVKDDDSIPINLSGYSARGVARFRYGTGSVLLDLDPKVVSGNGTDPTLGASGFIDVYIRPGTTSGLPIVQGIYDIEKYETVPASSGDWNVQKVARGYVNVIPEVTTSLS